MADKLKDYVPMSVRLRSDLAERLERHRAETGAPKTFTIEKALEEYFSRLDGVEKK